MLLFAMLLLQTQDTLPGVNGSGRPTFTAPRIEASVEVDGFLDEPAWQNAVRLTGFSQYEPVDGRPAEERTDVLVWYSPTGIHFGIVAWDSHPETIRATRADRDNIDADDHVLIYLDTFKDRRRAFFFGVNPLGIQQDGVRTEGAASAGNIFGGSSDRNPDYLYDSRGRVTDSGYVVEVRIPFKSLRYPGNGPQSWGVNVLRRTQRTGYNDTWTDVRRASASFLLQSGTMEGLRDLHRGLVFEAQPFVTASANGSLGAAGEFDRGEVDPEAGVNLRLGLTNLSLDGTINPDFSQVESDVSQVTVNERFALFFPEKRPFFLEGIELFSTPSQLVYTRQIVNPVAGAKVTGKFGNFGIAHLTAVDRVDDDGLPGDEDVLFNITRIRRDFGSNSLAGVTYTDRSTLDSPGFNRVISGDMRYVFGKLYYFEAQLGGSWTRAGASPVVSSPLWRMEYDRTGRSWGFNYRLIGIGKDFITRSGFVNRNDYSTAQGFNRFTLYGARGAWLENFTSIIGATRLWDYGDIAGDAIEGTEEFIGTLTFRGGWQLETRLNREFVDFDPGDYTGYTVDTGSGTAPFVMAEGSSGPIGSIQLKTPVFQGVDAVLTVGAGESAIFREASEGNNLEVTGEVNLRPTAGLRLSFRNTWSRLSREDGSLFARTIIPRLKVEFQPIRALFFRVIGEYVSQKTTDLVDPETGNPILINGIQADGSDDNDLRLDLLVSLEPAPGTVAFLGYGSSLRSNSTLSFRKLERTSDGFFVKLAYRFRQ